MPHPTGTKRKILVFSSMADISNFKQECLCDDFYVDRDLLSLVGSFTDAQIMIAKTKYKALVNPEIID
ncbi:MAG: hypothetical protein ACXWCZ_00625 [Flavisolibacter sp.]